MPGTHDAIMALVIEWPFEDEVRIPEFRWGSGDAMTPGEWADVRTLRAYAMQLAEGKAITNSAPQRLAMRLLRGLLSNEQARSLNRSGDFLVPAKSGSIYRLTPRMGLAERVEKHGRKWFVKQAFCLHDERDESRMPPADVTIAHLLMLIADEPGFLKTANSHRRDNQLWNRDYLRRLRTARTSTRA